ncbi:MAG: hypothetical protein ACRDCW_13520 [Sarcina sp.]
MYKSYKAYEHTVISDSLIDIIQKLRPQYILRDLEALVGKFIGEALNLKTLAISTTITTELNFYNDDTLNKLVMASGDTLSLKNFKEEINFQELIKKIKENLKDTPYKEIEIDEELNSFMNSNKK